MTKETWKQVPWADQYAVSNMGRVKLLAHTRTGKDGRKLRYQERLKATYQDSRGYWRVNLKGKTQLVHRIVAKLFVKGFRDGLIVDHINGDPSDCRSENLRWVTQQENLLNRHSHNAVSGHVGVYRIFITNSKPWVAQGKLNRKCVHLGCFKTKDEAIIARRNWENKVGATTSINTI